MALWVALAPGQSCGCSQDVARDNYVSESLPGPGGFVSKVAPDMTAGGALLSSPCRLLHKQLGHPYNMAANLLRASNVRESEQKQGRCLSNLYNVVSAVIPCHICLIILTR